MQSTAFRIVGVGVTVGLLLALVWVVRLAWVSNPTTTAPVKPTVAATATQAPVRLPTPTGTPTPTPTIELGNLQRITPGGFAFRSLPTYALEIAGGIVHLRAAAQAGTPDTFLLSGGPPAQLAPTLPADEAFFAAYIAAYTEENLLRASEPYSVTIDGHPGQAVDLTSVDSAGSVMGRLVLVQPHPEQLFVLSGQAQAAQWEQTTAQQFDALLASVALFDLPKAVLAQVTPTAQARTAATPKPSATRAQRASSASAASRAAQWQSYSNSNIANDLAVANTTIWVATDGGVVAWNKSNSTPVKFTTLDGLAVNRTTAVVNCPLRGFGIVFGSDQGLQIFDTQRGAWKVLNTSNSTMSFADVAALHCDLNNGFLVVGYRQHGLDLYTVADDSWTYYDETRGLQNNFVEALTVVGNRSALWVSSGFGISVIPQRGAPQFYSDSNSPLETNQIYRMVADATGAVWIGAQDALYKVVNNDWTVYDQTFVLASRFPAGAFTGLAVARDGTLWLGSDQGEVCHFDPVTVQCKDFFAGIEGMAVGALTSLTLAPDGNVYFATDRGGISVYNGEQWRTLLLPNERLAGNQVRDLAQDLAGSIWVVTEAGIQQLNPAEGTPGQLFTVESSGLTGVESEVLHSAPKTGIWLGALGASYFNGSTWQSYTSADGLAGSLVQAIATDNQGRTWFGTEFGLSIWNGSAFFNLNRENGLPSDNISALLADGATMWIGTSGGGLLRFEKNQIRLFNAEKVGLPSDSVTALVQTGAGELLVGTTRGLARFAEETATPILELSDKVITALALTPDGQIWAGTRDDGLFYFDGQRWTQPPGAIQPPAQYVTTILVDQQGVVWVGARNGGLIRYTP